MEIRYIILMRIMMGSKFKNINKMEKQTLLVPKGTEVEQVEIDGNKVVITFKDKDVFVPKDGDVCVGKDFFYREYIYMFQDKIDNFTCTYFCLTTEKFSLSTAFTLVNRPRKATPSEAAELFSAMEKAGYKWNSDEKKVENIRWRAKKGENYWYSSCDCNEGESSYQPQISVEHGGIFDNSIFTQGDYHKTEADCQKLCDQLNATVKNFVA